MTEDTVMGVPEWEAPRVLAGVVEETVRVGDTFGYRIEVEHPLDVSVKLPTKLELGAFTLNGVDHVSRPGEAGTLVETWTLKLGAYQLEAGEIPSLVLEVVTPEGPAALSLPATAVTVKSVVEEDGEGKPRELAPPEKVYVPDYTLLRVTGAVLGGIALALLVWRLWILWQRRKARRVIPPPPPRPADLRALDALRALQPELAAAKGRQRDLYFSLSEIVRDYLGERFAFDALECTTTELLVRIRERSTPGLDRRAFEAWALEADLVKFASQRPDATVCKQAVLDATGFVERTTAAWRDGGASRGSAA